MRSPKSPLILATFLASTLGASSAAAQYKQKNLVSNQKGMAIRTDPRLINGWGLAFFPIGLRMRAPECPPSMGLMVDQSRWW